MALATILDKILRNHRYATADDVRDHFGDYHNVLQWCANFLNGDQVHADDCIVDACTIAESQTPMFHEWLVEWAARATVRRALLGQRARIAELAPEYEKAEPVQQELPPLSPAQFQLLVNNSEFMHARLDVLCRFVLLIRGIAKESCDEVAAQLRISRSAVERAYRVAFEMLGRAT